MRLLQSKLTSDIVWTLGSFAILAVSGIVINFLVAWLRDAASLGVFNLSYAVYIVASQIAVFGLQYSVMRHAALHSDSRETLGRMLFSAGAFSFLLGLAAAIIVHFGAPYLGALFSSESTGRAIANAAFGLLLFPLNKVLLGYLNGLRHMRAFSILQSMRYLLVMIWVGGVAASDLDFTLATLGFVVAEVCTTFFAFLYLIKVKLFPGISLDREWVNKHFAFGSKSLLSGMFVEMNSRVDVLLLGIFMPEQAVGIYSFAAMLVDGLYHVMAMVRINFNPILVAALRDADWVQSQDLLRRSKRVVYPVALALSLCIVAGFWVVAQLILPERGLMEGLVPLCILLAGLTIISAFIPFDNLLMVSGHPGYQTLQHLTLVTSNVLLNLLWIPLFGITGAAFATATSYFVGMATLLILVRYFLRWNLLKNQIRV